MELGRSFVDGVAKSMAHCESTGRVSVMANMQNIPLFKSLICCGFYCSTSQGHQCSAMVVPVYAKLIGNLNVAERSQVFQICLVESSKGVVCECVFSDYLQSARG